jgi:hypothetical protein
MRVNFLFFAKKMRVNFAYAYAYADSSVLAIVEFFPVLISGACSGPGSGMDSPVFSPGEVLAPYRCLRAQREIKEQKDKNK